MKRKLQNHKFESDTVVLLQFADGKECRVWLKDLDLYLNQDDIDLVMSTLHRRHTFWRRFPEWLRVLTLSTTAAALLAVGTTVALPHLNNDNAQEVAAEEPASSETSTDDSAQKDTADAGDQAARVGNSDNSQAAGNANLGGYDELPARTLARTDKASPEKAKGAPFSPVKRPPE